MQVRDLSKRRASPDGARMRLARRLPVAATMAYESLLDRLLPGARRVEVDSMDLATSPERAWQRVRHGELVSSPLVRALFAVRTLPERLRGERPSPLRMRLDDLQSSREQLGFCVLAEDAPRQVAVGAIGKVWHLEIPFVHVEDARSYADFHEEGYVKVVWEIRVLPLGTRDCRVEVEVRVDATDDESWSKFEQYFRLIGPGSHFIRKTLLSGLAREFGSPNRLERERDLPGDELLVDASTQATHGITIAASPERIWPWLVQLGCRRAGFYSWDLLDNGNQRSLTEIDPELLDLRVGQVVPATPDGDDGFEVLRIEAPELLVLGGCSTLSNGDNSRSRQRDPNTTGTSAERFG